MDYFDGLKSREYQRVMDLELSQVLQVIDKHPGITRKQLIKFLKFRPSSVSTYVYTLLQKSLIYEGEIIKNLKKGRPEVPLLIREQRYLVISIYTISNQIYGVLFNLRHEIKMKISRKVKSDITNSQLSNLFVEMVNELKNYEIGNLGYEVEIIGAGFSIYGKVNNPDKILVTTSRWNNVANLDLKEVEKKTGLNISVYSTLEAQLNQLVMEKPQFLEYGTLMYHWGYGVGACFMLNGQPIFSENGSIVEVGHMNYVPDSSKQCFCGRKGCIETECAIWALIKERDEVGYPEDELEFENFVKDLEVTKYPELSHSAFVASYGLNALYQIFYPKNIILYSPFLSNEKLKEEFLSNFKKNLPLDSSKNMDFEFIDASYHEEIFGSTNSLVLDKLHSDMVVIT